MRESVRVLLMGCICSKRIVLFRKGQGGGGGGVHHRKISKSNRTHASSLSSASKRKKKEDGRISGNGSNALPKSVITTSGGSNGNNGSVTTMLRSNSQNNDVDAGAGTSPSTEYGAPINDYADDGDQARPVLKITQVSNCTEAEQVAAGWPSWLSSVAGEAIRGLVPRKGSTFTKLEKIGQGTYSNVFRAHDNETGKIVALKKVRFVNMDPESVRFMSREIQNLRKLDHPNIIKLEGLITSTSSNNLYLVFEYMDHDLAGLSALPGVKFTEPQVKCYMKQLLNGLDHCHSRGILHRDIKGSNLLIDNNGILKLADFGLATAFDPNQTESMTSCVVTLWYRPPELLLGATEYGVSIDMWSTGCILGELFAGKPIMSGRTEVEQMHKIFKLCGSPSPDYWKKSKLPHSTIFKPRHHYKRCVRKTFKEFPSSALDLMDVLLAIKPEERGTTNSALSSEFFTTKPCACDPSSLPKYPPSKELDAKLRNEEARRRKTVAAKGNDLSESSSSPSSSTTIKNSKESKKKQAAQQVNNSNNKSDDEKAAGKSEKGCSLHHSGPLLNPTGFGSSWLTVANKVNKNNGAKLAPTGGVVGGLMTPQRSFKSSHGGETSSVNLPDRGERRSREVNWRQAQLLDAIEASDMQEWIDQIDHLTSSSHTKDERRTRKEPVLGYGDRKINYSGPLMAPGVNVEDMLKEHERQIQQALRKAVLDKAKTKNYSDQLPQ